MKDLASLSEIIESVFERRSELSPMNVPSELHGVLEECLNGLDMGQLRVAEKRDGNWVVSEWLKKAVLLYFRAHDNTVSDAGFTRFMTRFL